MLSTAITKSSFENVFFNRDASLLKKLFLLLGGVALLAFVSQLSIPLQPVPLTFQSATIVLIGMAYGSRAGAMVVSAYLVAGACGLPVFADFSCGLGVFAGPTGGYLLGFLPAAFVSGWLAEKGMVKSIGRSFLTTLISAAIIFLCGVTYLSQFLSWQQAVVMGVMPFLISEPIKLLAVACIAPKLWKSA